MMRTTRCLFALGFSVSLAAACGDDDGSPGPVGGSGGRGGTAGRGGSAGTAGAAGAAGTAGRGGSGGMGGSSAGTGGSSAGTGGSGAGTGGTGGSGVEPPDAGPDAASDAGEVADGGPQPIACPDDLVEASADADTSAAGQGVIITRLVFVGTEVEVTFRAVGGDFDFAAPLQLCTGSEDTDCDADVQDVDGGGAAGVLADGTEVTYSTPLGDIVTAASGEIALVNGDPSADADPIIRAYVNWGDYVSLEATEGPNDGESLEEAAADEGADGVWATGSSIEVDGQTTIYATDDVGDADGFEVCTQTP
jgi:hypothetical protein